MVLTIAEESKLKKLIQFYDLKFKYWQLGKQQIGMSIDSAEYKNIQKLRDPLKVQLDNIIDEAEV